MEIPKDNLVSSLSPSLGLHMNPVPVLDVKMERCGAQPPATTMKTASGDFALTKVISTFILVFGDVDALGHFPHYWLVSCSLLYC